MAKLQKTNETDEISGICEKSRHHADPPIHSTSGLRHGTSDMREAGSPFAGAKPSTIYAFGEEYPSASPPAPHLGQPISQAQKFASKISSSLPLSRGESAKTEKISLEISISGNPHSWAGALSDLGFSKIDIGKSSLHLEHIQSLDLESRPYQFTNISLSKNSLWLEYSALSSQNPLRRKLQAAQLAFLTLSSIGSGALTPSLGAFISQCLGESAAFVSLDVDLLVAKNHELSAGMKERAERLKELYAQREENSRKMLADAKKLQELSDLAEKLQAVPDSALDEDVLEWLKTHGGEISLREFSATHNIPVARAGMSLDRLCKTGKIIRVEK